MHDRPVCASALQRCTLALRSAKQYPVITADRRFHDIVRKHPYLSDRIAHVESLGR
jgi:hypothetical protein